MENSTRVFFQKLISIDISDGISYHNVTLKKILPLLGCFLFMASGMAQSGTIQFSSADYMVNEADGTVTITLQRIGGSNGAIAVDFRTVDGTATDGDDYNGIPTPISITWPDGNTNNRTVTLPITNDLITEPDETFTAVFTSTNPDWVGTPSTATVTIIDTPPPPSGAIQFSSADYTVNEADGTVTITLQRIGGSNGAIAVDFRTVDGTATDGDDYNGIPTPISITWPDGNTNNRTVTLPITPDALNEENETFIAVFTSTNPDWVGTPSTATVTIIDTPPPPSGAIQFSSTNYSTSETAGTVTLELQRIGGSQGEITIDIQTMDGTATIVDDYAGIPTLLTLTWSDGNITSKTVTLPITADALAEPDETFSMVIISTNPGWVGTPSTATVTITDDPPGKIQFASANYNASETTGTVTLELQRVGGSQGEITIDIQTMDGTATIVDDYAGIPTPLTLTWSDGNITPKTVTLPITADALAEPDETFSMVITSTNPGWVGTPSTATVTIADDPPGAIQFASADYSTSETAGTVTLELQRVGGSQGEITIDIQTMDGTATITDDYAGIPTPLTLTWSDGNITPKTVTLPIIADALAEGDETFVMAITSTNLDWVGTPSTATVTIVDDPPGKIQFTSVNYSTSETVGTVTLELQRIGGSKGEITIDIQTMDGTATITDDYAGIPTPLTLTWSDGNITPKTVTLPIIADALTEGNETFTMAITSTTSGWVGTPSTATVTIADDPPGTIQFSSANYSTSETVGTATLELQRVGGSQGEITIDIQTMDGTATIVDDYAGIPTPLTLTWSDGNITPKTVTLPITNDELAEGDEAFSMAITSTNPGWVGTPGTAIVTITDNDGSVGCTVSVTVDAGPDQTICGNGAVNISATSSRAGMWSGGSGSYGDVTMAATTYTPDNSELGTMVTLTWTTTDPDGDGPCKSANDMVDITFNEEPNAGEDNDIAVCEGTIVNLQDLVSTPGGTFSGPAVGGSNFDTAGLALGDYQVTYTVGGSAGCPDDMAILTVTVTDDLITKSCRVLDIDFCTPDEAPFYNFYWDEMRLAVPGSEFFSQNAMNTLSFTEFTDGTALIEGTTQSGTCTAELYIILKDRKNWTDWKAGGGGFKAQGCDSGSLVKEDLRYYVVDGARSTITTTGGDCLEEGTFVVTQRPDPDDLSTGNYGVHAGPGGALFDSDTSAEGLAGWAWMGPESDKQRWKIDFNFHIACEENQECKSEEVCDGVDNDQDGDIDEGFDSDDDGTPDCEDEEVCDGKDNDGDGDVDEGFDSDDDGTPDCEDEEVCDGKDNDGDGDVDEGFDSDDDGTPDCEDEEVCDGIDNNGDGEIDEGLDCNDTPPAGCETAFARYEKSNTCFIDDGFDRWGWTNLFEGEGNYTMELYSGAGQCDLDKGEQSGKVEIDYSNGSVKVSIGLLPGFIMTEAQLYVGGVPYPIKGNKETVAPGQYPFNSGSLSEQTTYKFDPVDVSHISEGIHIIVHAVTCKTQAVKIPVSTEVKAYHKPFESTIDLGLNIPYDAEIEVRFLDLSGKMVMQKQLGSVPAGEHMLPIEVYSLATEVHIMMIDTGREVIRKKVYFHR